MEFTVNPDQFTMLDLGSLRYVDHFQNNSRYLMPWSERSAKIHRNWQLIDRTPSIYLHPRFREFKKSKKPKAQSRLKLSRAQKLARRARKYRVLPRNIRPFMCSRCGLNSFYLRTVKHHECRRRKYKPHTREELERVAAFGVRSGIRSAIRAFEISDTADAQIPTINCISHFDLEETIPPIKNPKPPSGFTIKSKLKQPSVRSFVSPSAFHWTSSCDSSTTAFCCSCGLCFSGSADFDRHLNQSPTCVQQDNEIKFLVKNFKKFPPEGVKLNVTIAEQPMQCFGCGRVDFRNSTDFHQHIFLCAAKDEPPVLSLYEQ
ncbi:hypothetical protein M3Y98_00939900 [Aphelenchoides besseyi]|nr:hypothetical protein M3Y98_00939900 [Aphelenchoides besseyi]KAI6194324.1 hypothetical protein M3Y96_01113000 [Aphelenchoides besseyi]